MIETKETHEARVKEQKEMMRKIKKITKEKELKGKVKELKTLKDIYERKESPELISDLIFDEIKEEAIKRAQEYHNKFVLSGDYYYKGMKDAEMFAHDLKEEDLI